MDVAVGTWSSGIQELLEREPGPELWCTRATSGCSRELDLEIVLQEQGDGPLHRHSSQQSCGGCGALALPEHLLRQVTRTVAAQLSQGAQGSVRPARNSTD